MTTNGLENGMTEMHGEVNGMDCVRETTYRENIPSEIYVEAIKEMDVGEELTFNYATTEFDDPDSFECTCGSPGCYGLYRGFVHLSREQQQAIRHLLSPYLRFMFDTQQGNH